MAAMVGTACTAVAQLQNRDWRTASPDRGAPRIEGDVKGVYTAGDHPDGQLDAIELEINHGEQSRTYLPERIIRKGAHGVTLTKTAPTQEPVSLKVFENTTVEACA